MYAVGCERAPHPLPPCMGPFVVRPHTDLLRPASARTPAPTTTSTTVYDASGPARAPTLSRRCTRASYHGGRRFFTGSLVAANGHLSDVGRTPTRSATLARPFHGSPGDLRHVAENLEDGCQPWHLLDARQGLGRHVALPGGGAAAGALPGVELAGQREHGPRLCSRCCYSAPLPIIGPCFVALPRAAPPPSRDRPTVIRPTFLQAASTRSPELGGSTTQGGDAGASGAPARRVPRCRPCGTAPRRSSEADWSERAEPLAPRHRDRQSPMP
jgi:hypothetical protein